MWEGAKLEKKDLWMLKETFIGFINTDKFFSEIKLRVEKYWVKVFWKII